MTNDPATDETHGSRELQPGDLVTISLLDPSRTPISGQVLAANDAFVTIYEPAPNGVGPGYFEEIPITGIARIERHGSAPLTVTIADAFQPDVHRSWLRRKWGCVDVLAATIVVVVVLFIAFNLWLSCCAVLP